MVAGPDEKIESAMSAADKDTEVEVYNPNGFPVRNSLAELRVNDKILAVGGSYSHKDGDLRYLSFKVKSSDLNGAEAHLKVAQRSEKDQSRMLPAQVKNKTNLSK